MTPGLFVILHKQHLTQCQICSCNTNLGNCHIRFSFSLNYVHSLMIKTMKINYCKLLFPKSISSRRSLQLKCPKRELHIISLTVLQLYDLQLKTIIIIVFNYKSIIIIVLILKNDVFQLLLPRLIVDFVPQKTIKHFKVSPDCLTGLAN